TPQSLRDRLSQGLVYPAARVDAALSNYFRLGNLTALRELALLWLADEVDTALRAYREEHGIKASWEARERIVVALTGGPEGDTLLRRGARIAQRSGGGQLFAVHVTSPDGLAGPDTDILGEQRKLVETLGGSFHQLVAEQVPSALVDFARSVNATQLVIGVSRRSRLQTFFGGAGTSSNVIRLSGDIDVHIVSHSEAGKLQLPSVGGALSMRRRIGGLVVAVVALPLLTVLLSLFRSNQSLPSDVLLFQLLIVIVALVDELAHTNAPGSQHVKRWEDVRAILDAGINVISTVNIQHIESLNDVAQQITGVPQRETIPDSVLRGAEQVELIDLTPQSLRDRLSQGLVYPAARVDAALSNYFRLGNLTALRELALL
ncbi:MAG: universal stress protein, partial [Leifsonia sp.]